MLDKMISAELARYGVKVNTVSWFAGIVIAVELGAGRDEVAAAAAVAEVLEATTLTRTTIG